MNRQVQIIHPVFCRVTNSSLVSIAASRQPAAVMLGWSSNSCFFGKRFILVLGIVGLVVGWTYLKRQPREIHSVASREIPEFTPHQQAEPSAAASIPAPEPAPPPAGEDPAPLMPLKPMVVDLGGGRFAVGGVTIDRRLREITLPAEVNMVEGPVEYALVSKQGKIHEAVFATAAEARDLHVAALLLGVTPSSDLGPQNGAATVKRGAAVVITVEWERNGPTERIFLNEAVNLSDPSTKAVSGNLPAGAWIYNGSRIEGDGVFAATRHGSMISIIRDDDALVNNPGASRDNDEIHTPNAGKLPPKGHPVRIVLRVK